MQTQQNMNSQEEEPVLGVYFDATYSSDDSDSLFSPNPNKLSKHHHPIRRNADPVETPQKPPTYYATRVPAPSTAIAAIAPKRLDRISKAHAQRTDACLICASEESSNNSTSSSSKPETKLSQLPCGHAWCRECLARAFHFVLSQHAFGRLQCCEKADIPLKYFAKIVEKRDHPAVEYEVLRPEPAAAAGAGTARDDSKPWNSTRVIEHVEKDQDVFISAGDMASYRMLLEEHHAPARLRVYCYGQACGRYIPEDCRSKTVGKCVNCSRRTCLKCRRNAKTHDTDSQGKCRPSKARIEKVNNEAKTLALAKRKGWKRCPRCRMFVTKERGGCSSVVCRCGRLFFYS